VPEYQRMQIIKISMSVNESNKPIIETLEIKNI
jgi:hypothetical protein